MKWREDLKQIICVILFLAPQYFLQSHDAHATYAIAPLIIAAAISAIPAIANIFKGGAEKRKGMKIAKKNVRPEYSQEEQFQDILGQYQQRAAAGLPAESLAWLKSGTDAGYTASLRASQVSGGTPNTATDLYGSYASSLGGIATQDAAMREQHEQQALAAQQQALQIEEADWLRNKYYPYADKAQYATGLQTAGQQTQQAGFSSLAQIGAQVVASYGYKMAADPTSATGTKPVNAPGANPMNTTPVANKPLYDTSQVVIPKTALPQPIKVNPWTPNYNFSQTGPYPYPGYYQ